MKELTKEQIVDVMRCAGNYQRQIFQLLELDIIDVTKYKTCLVISVNYKPSVVSYSALYNLFRDSFKDYQKYISTDECYSILLRDKERAAHFQVRFYA